MTMAAAPASSRRLTVSRSSTSGEAPGMNGCGRSRPRYFVLRSMASFPGGARGRPARPSALRGRLRRRVLAQRRDAAARELLVAGVALPRVLLGPGQQLLEALGVDLLDHPEARLVPHVVPGRGAGGRSVELQRRLAGRGAVGIEAVERPHPGAHRQLLLLGA